MQQSVFAIPPPDESPARWHVSPAVDLSAYAFSWVWVLAPLALLGDARPDYLFLYLFILAATDVHRHYGLPYVYMDGRIRHQYPLRFTLFPLACFAAWMWSPWLAQQDLVLSSAAVAGGSAQMLLLLQVLRRDGPDAPASLLHAFAASLACALAVTTLPVRVVEPGWWWGLTALGASIYVDRTLRLGGTPALILALLGVTWIFGGPIEVSMRSVFGVVAAFAFVWNIWHVYMQKYGIMRLYNAKGGGGQEVPGWIDRLLIFAWVPLYFVWLGPAYREVALENLKRGSAIIPPFLDSMEAIAPVSVPLAVGILVFSVAAWLRAEWRASQLRNPARLLMAAGTFLMGAAFLLVHPVKAYLAVAFSHAVEYMVFVWAFQRRRYRTPMDPQPLLARVLTHPALAYGGFILGLSAVFLYLKYWGRSIFPDLEQPHALGFRTAEWMFYWSIYQSFVHFYYDGFLWKMRTPDVRATI